GTFNLLTSDEAGIARIDDIYTTQHLTHDYFNVLVVDLHTLQAVDVLHFVDDVAGQTLNPLQAQDIVRIRRAIDDHLALVHNLAVVHQHLLLFGDQRFMADTIEVGDDKTLLALGVLTE